MGAIEVLVGLKYRTITKAARSLPEDLIEVKRMFLRRVVFIVQKYNIPPSLFINIDKTGLCLLPSKNILGAHPGQN